MSRPLVPRIYGALLRALPASFRLRYADEMRRMFEEEWAESGTLRRARLGVRGLRDVVATAIALRVSPERVVPPRVAIASQDTRGGRFAGVQSDLRVALRGLRRRPAFTATAVVTVALGIGATAAVFSVVDATVLRALRGIPNQDRLVALWTGFERHAGQDFPLSAAEFTDLRTDVGSFERVGAWSVGETLLEARDGGAARTIDVAFTVGDIYSLVGARTVLGRLPGAADDRLGAPGVAVLSHALWMEAFGADSGVVGTRTLMIGREPATIVGVLAPEVALPGDDASVWVHWVLDPANWATNRSGHGLNALGLLRADVTEGAARAELAALHRRWAERYAGQHSFGLDGHTLSLASIDERVLGKARRVALLLSVAAGVLLLLACANVANLLLARGETRTAEVGVRIALGASPRRVAQPVMLEGLTLGGAGGALGLVLAGFGLPLLLRLAPQALASSTTASIDVRVVTFAVLISLLTGILFTIAPAWKAARRAPSDLMRASGRGRTGTTRGLRVLVAGQTALATVLLVGAALLARSLQQLNAVDPGLSTAARVALDLTLPVERYRDAHSIIGFYDAARERIASLPGVEGVTTVRNLPLRDDQRNENVLREGATNAQEALGVGVQAASPGVLRTLGIPLIAGRDLEPTDRVGAVRVALVNRSAAQALWPGESAIGKRLRVGFLRPEYGLVTIVGVYADVRSAGLSTTAKAELVLPVAQADGWSGWVRNLTLVAHTSAAPAGTIAAIRAAIRDLDPAVAVELPTTMQEVLREATARERFLAVLLAVFGALALAIAAVGVFGVVSFTVARQTREIAIRNALGAGRGEILRGVLRATALVAGAGALAGALVAALSAPALGSFLYNVAPRDGVVLATVPVVLVTVALLSSLAPAVRAARVPPTRALQEGD